MVNEYLVEAASREYASPAGVERLRVESPAVFIMLVPSPVAIVAATALTVIGGYRYAQGARLKKARADSEHEDARRKKIENDLEEAKANTQIAVHEALQKSIAGTTSRARTSTSTASSMSPTASSARSASRTSPAAKTPGL